MSEKRHASKDAKATDTYQRTKRAREEREEQRRLTSAQLTRHTTGQTGSWDSGLWLWRSSFGLELDKVSDWEWVLKRPVCRLPVWYVNSLSVCLFRGAGAQSGPEEVLQSGVAADHGARGEQLYTTVTRERAAVLQFLCPDRSGAGIGRDGAAVF